MKEKIEKIKLIDSLNTNCRLQFTMYLLVLLCSVFCITIYLIEFFTTKNDNIVDNVFSTWYGYLMLMMSTNQFGIFEINRNHRFNKIVGTKSSGDVNMDNYQIYTIIPMTHKEYLKTDFTMWMGQFTIMILGLVLVNFASIVNSKLYSIEGTFVYLTIVMLIGEIADYLGRYFNKRWTNVIKAIIILIYFIVLMGQIFDYKVCVWDYRILHMLAGAPMIVMSIVSFAACILVFEFSCCKTKEGKAWC